MVRAVSVMLSVLVLLGVGWYLGHRSVAATGARSHDLAAVMQPPSKPAPVENTTGGAPPDTLQARIQALEERAADAEGRAEVAEARSKLWQARGEMLVAVMEVGKRNFARAREWASTARDHMTRAAAAPGLTLDLGSVRNMLDTAINQIENGDAEAVDVLMRAATELRRVLEQAGQA
jgi:hypothetical protein